MQASWNRKWSIGLIIGIVLLTTLSCSVSDLIGTKEPLEPPIDLEGVWLNPSTGSSTTIIWRNEAFEVVSVIDDDGEYFPVRETDWDGSRIRWTYYVPSTDYTVTFTMTSLSGDNLDCDWFNDHNASGTRTLRRQLP
jgi:hypothetical protein